MRAATKYRYNRLTWAEMSQALELQKVVILPTGSTEQHSRHLPLDVDVFLCESVCLEIGRRIPDETKPGSKIASSKAKVYILV